MIRQSKSSLKVTNFYHSHMISCYETKGTSKIETFKWYIIVFTIYEIKAHDIYENQIKTNLCSMQKGMKLNTPGN